MKPWTRKSITLGVFGLFFFLIGMAMYPFWPIIFSNILKAELPLTPESRTFDIWKDTKDVPINVDFYFFNWTNPHEINDEGSKPNFVELGPYSFIERRQKVNTTFHPENKTVSYFQRRYWYFDEQRSNGSLSDVIVTLNVVAVSSAHKIRYWEYRMNRILSNVLKNHSIYTIKTVEEYLFVGINDSLLEIGKLLSKIGGEEIPPADKVGWFYMRNGSTAFDGYFNVGTGIDNLDDLGVVKSWNYSSSKSFYKHPCNRVGGSAGEFFPPNRNTNDISIWMPDICRSITFDYSSTVSHQGVSGYQYKISAKTLGNDTIRHYIRANNINSSEELTTEKIFNNQCTIGTASHDNQIDPDAIKSELCYCNGKCSPVGLINITSCRYGSPAFMSLPHFHKADSSLRQQITGMNPSDEKHNFYITLEPKTGIPLEVLARLQVNILLQPSKTISLFQKVPHIYFPIFWFDVKANITEDMAWNLQRLILLPKIGSYINVIMIISGLSMLSVVGVIQFL